MRILLAGNSPRGLHISLEGGLEDVDLLNMGTPGKATPPAPATPGRVLQPNEFERSTKNRASERYPVPHKKAAKIEQQMDQVRKKISCDLGLVCEEEI